MPLLLFCVFLFPLLFETSPNQLLRSDAMIPPNDLHRFNRVCVFECVCVHMCVWQRATARVISSLVAMVCVGLREREREREEETSIARQERSIFQTSKYASCVWERTRKRESARKRARKRGWRSFRAQCAVFVCVQQRENRVSTKLLERPHARESESAQTKARLGERGIEPKTETRSTIQRQR